MWFDEGTTLCAAAVPVPELPGLISRLEGAPPLHALLLKLWLPLFSDPALGLRSFSALCGVAALGVFALVARRLAPGTWKLACLLAGLSSFWLHFSQDGRGYALLLLVGLLEVWLLLRLMEKLTPGRAAAWGAAAALGLYTHNFFHLHLMAQAAYLASQGWRKRLALFAIPYLAFLPWAASLVRQVGAWSQVSVLSNPLGPRELLEVFGTMAADTGFLSFAHPGITAILGLAVLAAIRKSDKFLLSQILLPVLFLILAERLLGRAATQARYLILISPFVYLALSRHWIPVFALGLAAYLWAGKNVDPRLGQLAALIGPGPEPVVHLDAAYYTPMRCYYLPERRHYLPPQGGEKLNWAALPGPPAELSREEIAKLGPVIVLDPQRTVFPGRVGRAEAALLR